MTLAGGRLSFAGRSVDVWQVYIGVGALIAFCYWQVPPFAGNGWMMPILSMSSAIAIALGVRIYRPGASTAWLLMALGQFLFACGDIYTYSYPRLFGGDVPFPSPGDAIYLMVYPAQLAGLVLLIRRRNPHMERATLIDAFILTVGLGVVQWILLISPYVQDHSTPLLPRLVSIGYPTMDTMLLAGAMLLAVDTGKRAFSFYLLSGSILCLLLTDFVYGLTTLNGTYNGQIMLDFGWIGYYLLWGAAALHPSMRQLEEAAPERESRLSTSRLIVLTLACLIAPLFESYLQARNADIDNFVLIGASAALFLLVVARMAGLVRQEERSTTRERALRKAGLALVKATGREEIREAALDAAGSLTGPGYEVRLELAGEESAAPSSGGRPREGFPLTVRNELGGILVVDGEDQVPVPQKSALQSLAASVSLALESATLSEEVHRRESEARFSSLVRTPATSSPSSRPTAPSLYQSPSIERVLGYRAEERGRLAVRRPAARRASAAPADRRRAASPERDRRRGDRVLAAPPRRPLRQFEILHTNLLDDEHVRRHRAEQPRRQRAQARSRSSSPTRPSTTR